MRNAACSLRLHPTYIADSLGGVIQVIEAAMLWNEPNNKSHWDFVDVDPQWLLFSRMTILAAQAIATECQGLPRVLGGLSPIDPRFIERMRAQGVMNEMDAVAVHGFPLDWNYWPINEWPEQLASIRAITALPVWVSEVGVSTFGADEVQEFGLERTMQLLRGRAPRIHWYSLFDLPRAWPATTRHREAEGSSYYRHFHMGLVREDGSNKPAYAHLAAHTPDLGICQWFHFEDPRLDDAVSRLRELGVRHLRTGLSWSDSLRPNSMRWFDRLMRALDEFAITVTFCFTPESHGIFPHHTSAPRDLAGFADFCAQMIRRYSPAALRNTPLATAPRAGAKEIR
jgi:beta-xylosidase